MTRLLHQGPVQAKLTINEPGDRFEQEADRVARKVLRMSDPSGSPLTTEVAGWPGGVVQRKCACGGGGGGEESGECEECRRHALGLQRQAAAPSDQRTAPSIVGDVVRSPGRILDHPTRRFMEARFGADFSSVRIHTDAMADESAWAVNAGAYTVGRDLVFRSGQYQPDSQSGRQLLAHELTHVLQQDSGNDFSVQRAVCESGNLGDARCGDAQGSSHPAGVQVEDFDLDKAQLKPGHLAMIGLVKAMWGAGGGRDPLEIHGYASCDGKPNANADLSCRRAEAVKAECIKRGVTTSIKTFAHGETDEFGASLDSNRRVIVSIAFRPNPPPVPEEPPPSPKPYPVVRVWVNSFIPDAVIDGPPGSECFTGDSRTFSNATGASSRTHQLIQITPGFDRPTQSFKRIGRTHEVDCDTRREIDADSESIDALSNSASIGQRTSAQAFVSFSADASNPLVTFAPAINLEAEFRLDLASRRCKFDIEHDGFPAYEAYISAGDAPGVTVYTYDPRIAGEGITALFAPMDKSGSRALSF